MRAVAQSLFPELVGDKYTGPIVGSVIGGTNADLMFAIRRLYLSGAVCDVTHGEGGWWTRYRPAELVAHDLYKLDGVDFTNLPELDGTYDAVCFDPPYIPQGGVVTSTAGAFVHRFGLARESYATMMARNTAGVAECARVLRHGGWLLVKCGDFVDGGRFTLASVEMIAAGRAAGLVDHDLIVHHTGSGPGGHNIAEPIRARRHHSYLIVFRKP